MSAASSSPLVHDARRARVTRRLAVAWQNPMTRQITPIGLLEYDNELYSFTYIQNANDTPEFRPLPGFPDLFRLYQSEHLFPLFAQRVMDPRRPDFARYVERLGLPADATPWEQMSRSGGARHGDTLQLFPEPDLSSDGFVTCTFLVHGVRHVPDRPIQLGGQSVRVNQEQLEAKLGTLRQGDPLRLIGEPANPINPHAVITATLEGFPLGWVPDLLLDDLHLLIAEDYPLASVTLVQANGPEAPAHMRVVARLQAKANKNYHPFSGQKWRPLGETNQVSN